MVVQTRRELFQVYFEDFCREQNCSQARLPEVVDWIIDTGRYEFTEDDIRNAISSMLSKALSREKDIDNARVYVNAVIDGDRVWAHRDNASWALRKAFCDDLADCGDKDYAAYSATIDKFNELRKPGEAMFQKKLFFGPGKEEGDSDA